MIKINLLPQKRTKRARPGQRAQVAPSGDSGAKYVLIGLSSIIGAAALVFLAIDMPLRNSLADAKADNRKVVAEIAKKENDPKLDLKSYDLLVQQKADAVKKIQSINRLLDNRVVPANILHELGQILSVRGPTMTETMAKQVDKDGPKRFQTDWDPTHVWLSNFKDTAGAFTLEGGAQSKDDVTQLSKRLAASVYFTDVSPSFVEPTTDRESGIIYYKYTITGKVAY
jgi:Tfp pilus assembly protein PilN